MFSKYNNSTSLFASGAYDFLRGWRSVNGSMWQFPKPLQATWPVWRGILHTQDAAGSAVVHSFEGLTMRSSPLKLVIALSWSEDRVLQQVLTDERGQLLVGETAHFSVKTPYEAVFASRISNVVKAHEGKICLICPQDIAVMDWTGIIERINPRVKAADVEIQLMHQGTSPTSNPVDFPWLGSAQLQYPVRSARTKRHVFSLSYDLVDSTALMVNLGAESYSLLLSQVHKEFASIAASWQGQVDSPQGDDGCMCYFGLQLADEHAGLSCLQAALEMRDRARGCGWQVRIGIAAGWLAVDHHHPVGLSVHLAARLQKIAAAGAILVTEQLATHFSSVFDFESQRESSQLKGFQMEVKTALLKSYNPALKCLPPEQRDATHSIFTGRTAEIDQLNLAWRETLGGRGSDVLIKGLPGVGKSSLVKHWMANLSSHVTRHLLSCRPHDYRQPFAALSRWMSALLAYKPATDAQYSKQLLKSSMARQPSLWPYRSEVAELLEVTDDAINLVYEDAEAKHSRVISALAEWIGRKSRQHPMLFVIEDYQWMDASTARWIQAVKNLISEGAPILLIVVQRPTQTRQNNYAQASRTIELNALDLQSSMEMISALAPEITHDLELMQQIQNSSRGIPLYLCESIRLLQSNEYRQKIRLARQMGTGLPVPLSLHDLLMQRIDQIGEARLLAQIGSVLGESFSLDLLMDLYRRFQPHVDADAHLRMMLGVLQQQNIWVALPSSTEDGYEFAHALIRDVAYQSMWEADRIVMHEIAAEIFKERLGRGLDQNHTQLGRHLAAAGNIREAIDHLLKTGKRSKKRGAHEVAMQTLQTTLELIELDVPDEKSLLNKIEAHLGLAGQMLITQGYSTEAVLEHYNCALELASSIAHHNLMLRAQLGIQSFEFMRGNFKRAYELIDLARQTSVLTHSVMGQLQCDWALANLLFYEGRLAQAESLFDRCVALCADHELGGGLIQNPHVMAMMYRAFTLCCMGRYDIAIELSTQGCDLADACDHKLARLQAHGIAAMVFYNCGMWPRARDAATKGLSSCQPGEYRLWYAHAQFMRHAASAQLGDVHANLKGMRQAHQDWAQHGGRLTRSYYWAVEAQILLEHADLSAAGIALSNAENHLRHIPEKYFASEITRLKVHMHRLSKEKLYTEQISIDALLYAYDEACIHGAYGLALRIAIDLPEQASFADQKFTKLAQERLVDCLSKIQGGSEVVDYVKAKKILAGKRESQIFYLSDFKRA